jgi:hypothetical protein
MEKTLRGPFYERRGTVEQHGNGPTIARDNFYRPLAYFDGERTNDPYGRTIGYGDLTTVIAWDSTERR